MVEIWLRGNVWKVHFRICALPLEEVQGTRMLIAQPTARLISPPLPLGHCSLDPSEPILFFVPAARLSPSSNHPAAFPSPSPPFRPCLALSQNPTRHTPTPSRSAGHLA